MNDTAGATLRAARRDHAARCARPTAARGIASRRSTRCGRSCSRKPTRCSRRSSAATPADLREELGDFLFEAVFLAQHQRGGRATSPSPTRSTRICRQAGAPPPARLRARRRRRRRSTSGQVHRAVGRRSRRTNARAAGDAERSRRPCSSGVPEDLPALLRAYQISARAAAVGFDWARAGRRARQDRGRGRRGPREVESGATGDLSRAEEEMGDLLFAIANLSRKLGIEPEAALRRANDKFTTAVRSDGARVRRARASD